MEKLTLEILKQAVASHAAAFRCVTEFQPAGGPGDKVFPPTYEGGKYAVETRIIDAQRVPCVLLDSVQSQANRMELALLDALKSKRITLPLIEAKFNDEKLKKKFTITSLEAPHRVADAIFRDSLLGEVIFRKSEIGKLLDTADIYNATGLFKICPTALIFGLWDSTGPRGGLGAKFQRAIVSEMVGIDSCVGVKSSSRIDPAQIVLDAGPLYQRAKLDDALPSWTLNSNFAQEDKKQPKKMGKDGKPSEANHGNIKPIIDEAVGGVTISKAIQTTVLSLAALRRLRFPINSSPESDSEVDNIARTVLAALGLAAASLMREQGADLRSRCQLFPTQAFVWELLNEPGSAPKIYDLPAETSIQIFKEAVAAAEAKGLLWQEGKIKLVPSAELVELVRRSQEIATQEFTEGGA